MNAKCHLGISDALVCPSLALSVCVCVGGVIKKRKTGRKDAGQVVFFS